MKKLLALLLAAIMLLSCCGCAAEDGTDKEETESTAKTEPTQETEPEAQLGYEVGNRCYGAQLPVITAEGETEDTIDPAKTGKVTVLNFWGTWCEPCKMELPSFHEIAEEYAEDVVVIAVHSYNDRNNAIDYIAQNYADSRIVFSWDSAQENPYGDYYATMGAPGYYPYTLILDENGVITQTHIGIMEYDDLKQAVENAMIAE